MHLLVLSSFRISLMQGHGLFKIYYMTYMLCKSVLKNYLKQDIFLTSYLADTCIFAVSS